MYWDRVDILIPTKGERINGLLYQIGAFLNQNYLKITIWVLIDSDIFDVINARIRDTYPHRHHELKTIKVPDEWRGDYGHNPIRYAIEKLPLKGEWFNTSGDDDCVMEWGIGCLIENSDDVDMVIGKCIPTRRNHDYQRDILGRDIELGKITGSCCLYRTERVREIGYPTDNYNADWMLIEEMVKGNFRKIDSVIYVMPQSLDESSI